MEILVSWKNNVKDKFLNKILPKYVKRTEDLEALAESLTSFFSRIVFSARELEAWKQREDFLIKYLENFTIFLNKENVSLPYLQALLSQIISNTSKRGTLQALQEEGEVQKIIGYLESDEYIFNILTSEHVGWWIDKESPIYKGISRTYLTEKGYRILEFADYEKFAFVGGRDSTPDIETYWVKSPPALGQPGLTGDFGGLNPYHDGAFTLPNYLDGALVCSPKISYEVTFKIKHSGLGTIYFGCIGLDSNGQQVIFDSVDGGPTPYFLEAYQPAVKDEYIFIRGIIFSPYVLEIENEPDILSANFNDDGELVYESEENIDSLSYDAQGNLIVQGEDPEIYSLSEIGNLQAEVSLMPPQKELNIGRGTNLVMTEETVKLIPFVYVSKGLASNNQISTYFKEVKVRPLLGLKSRGYLSPSTILELWFTNNNKDFREDRFGKYPAFENILSKYILPYDVTINTQNLG